MLLFVKPRVLKDELNARFREEHPELPPSLTLSKIRSVKRQALLGCYRAVRRVLRKKNLPECFRRARGVGKWLVPAVVGWDAHIYAGFFLSELT